MPQILSINNGQPLRAGRSGHMIIGADFGFTPGRVIFSHSTKTDPAALVLSTFDLWSDATIILGIPYNGLTGSLNVFVEDVNGFANAEGMLVNVLSLNPRFQSMALWAALRSVGLWRNA